MAGKFKPLPTLEQCKERYDYDPETGIFTWNSGARKGKEAGSRNAKDIELYFGSLGRFKAHRIAWLYITGEDPGEFLIDHRYGDTFLNTKDNLRKATPVENSQNSVNPVGSSGVPGVDKHGSGWRARIRHQGRRINLGVFASVEAAEQAIIAERLRLHGEFARDHRG